MKLVEISTNLQWIIKWKNRGCTTLDDVSRIDPNDQELKKYQAEIEQFREVLLNSPQDSVICIFSQNDQVFSISSILKNH